MKAQMKAIMASAVVIALCLAAVGGVTYSWFSDTESADININTATVTMDVVFGEPISLSTITSITGNNGHYTITNLAANFTGTIPVTIDNKSNVKTIFRQVIEITNSTLTDYDKDNITINDTLLNDVNFYDDESGSTQHATIQSEWEILDDENNDPSQSLSNIVIKTPMSYGDNPYGEWTPKDSKEFFLTIKYELYQGDYYSESEVSDNGSVNVTAEGVSVGIDFGSVTLNDGTALTGKRLAVNSTENSNGFSISDTGIILSFKLDGSDATFTGEVPITVTLPGNYSSNPTVTYIAEDGSTENKTVISASYDSTFDETELTFETTHFSDYVITSDDTELTVNDEASFRMAMENFSGTVILGEDISRTSKYYPERNWGNDIVWVNNSISLNLNSHSINNICLIYNHENGRFIIDGSNGGKIINKSTSISGEENSMGYCIVVNMGELTIIDGYFESDECTVVQSGMKITNSASVIIENGSFIANGTYNGYYWTLNCKDNIGATFSVKGGSYYMYDPSNGNTESPNDDFVADGYVSISSDNYYNVVIQNNESVNSSSSA